MELAKRIHNFKTMLFPWNKGIIYTRGRGWYRRGSYQPNVHLFVPEINKIFLFAQIHTFLVD
jgi:hypothetical protein